MNDGRFDTTELSFCTVHIEDVSSNIFSFSLLLDQINLFKRVRFEHKCAFAVGVWKVELTITKMRKY
jgi:hypothetical protein